MAVELAVVLLTGGIAFLLSVYATIRVWRTDMLEKGQRVAQTIIVWVLPFIGAIIALALLRDERPMLLRKHIPQDDHGFGGPDTWH